MLLGLRVGDRVKVSEEGLRAGIYRSQRDRLGTITGWSRLGGVMVRWDGNRNPSGIGEKFIKLAEPASA